MWQFIAFSVWFIGPAFGRRSQPQNRVVKLSTLPRAIVCLPRCRRSTLDAQDSFKEPEPRCHFARPGWTWWLIPHTYVSSTTRVADRDCGLSEFTPPPLIVRQDPYSPLLSGLEPRCTETRRKTCLTIQIVSFFPSQASVARGLPPTRSSSNAQPVKDRKSAPAPKRSTRVSPPAPAPPYLSYTTHPNDQAYSQTSTADLQAKPRTTPSLTRPDPFEQAVTKPLSVALQALSPRIRASLSSVLDTKEFPAHKGPDPQPILSLVDHQVARQRVTKKPYKPLAIRSGGPLTPYRVVPPGQKLRQLLPVSCASSISYIHT